MSASLTSADFERIRDLPSPRFVSLALLESAAGPVSAGSASTDLLTVDPAAAARLLREANGPALRLRVQILDIPHAAAVLGEARVRRLLLTLPLGPPSLPTRLWQHSVARAEAAARLARVAGLDRGTARSAGLLAEMGSIALALASPPAFRKASRAAASKPADAWPSIARRVIGMGPQVAAREIGERWGLPARICEAIAVLPGENSGDDLVALLHAAEALAWRAGFPARTASAPPAPVGPAQHWLERVSASAAGSIRSRVLRLAAGLDGARRRGIDAAEILGTAYGHLAALAGDAEETSQRLRTLNTALQNIQHRLGERDPADALLCEIVATLGFDRAALLEGAGPGGYQVSRLVTASGEDLRPGREGVVFRIDAPARTMRLRDDDLRPEVRAFLHGFGARAVVVAPLAAAGRSTGLIAADRAETGSEVDEEDELLVGRLARETGVLLENWRLVQAVRSLAVTDVLTGLSNRRSIMDTLEVEVERARRTRRPLAIAMFDLDRFKGINDGLGHSSGDALLADFAGLLREGLRRGDHVGRYGGEEFLGVLPGADAERARLVAERIREATEAYGQKNASRYEGLPIHVSVGIAAFFGEEETSSDLLRRADVALYRAKSEGRNRVVAAAGLGVLAGSLP